MRPTSLSRGALGPSSLAFLLSGSGGFAVTEVLPFASPFSPANTLFTASSLDSLSRREEMKRKARMRLAE